jgi:predicted RNA-binding Zn ribbon-like protein
MLVKMKRSAPLPKPQFELLAGCVCLDFANTLDKRFSGAPADKLDGYEALIAFGQQTGEFSPAEAQELRREGARHKAKASRIFRQAIELRELIFRILTAVEARREVAPADAAALNTALQRVNAASLLVPGKTQRAWRWEEKQNGAERLLGKIVRGAAEILTSDDVEHVKRCASKKCAWLFLDRSRSGNRRWCEMRTCGSQHKAKAYYHRKVDSQADSH